MGYAKFITDMENESVVKIQDPVISFYCLYDWAKESFDLRIHPCDGVFGTDGLEFFDGKGNLFCAFLLTKSPDNYVDYFIDYARKMSGILA